MKRKNIRAIFPWMVFGVVICAAVLRIVHITSHSISLTEASFWRLTQFSFIEFVQRAAADIYPIGYHIVLRLWLYPVVSLDFPVLLLWLRLLSVLLAALGVLAMYWAGLVLFRSRWIGLTAAILTAVNAYQIPYAQRADMYTLGILLVPICIALVVKIFRARDGGWAAWYGSLLGITAGFLLYIHYYTLFSFAALVLGGFGYVIWRMIRRRTFTFHYPYEKAIIGGFILAILIFAPWMPVLISQYHTIMETYAISFPDVQSISSTTVQLLAGSDVQFDAIVGILALIFILAVVLACLVVGRSREDLLLVLCFIIPLITGAATSMYYDRFFVFASVALMLLIARTASFFPAKFHVAIVVVMVVGGVTSTVLSWQDIPSRESVGVYGAARYVAERAYGDEAVIVPSVDLYIPILFHHNEFLGLLYTPKLFVSEQEFNNVTGRHVLTRDDVVGTEVFEHTDVVWIIDQEEKNVPVPETFTLVSKERFNASEMDQGEIIVREYRK